MDEFNGEPFVKHYRRYTRWLTDPDLSLLVVRFEDMLANDGELRRIAQWLGVPFQDDAFEVLYGGSRTWSGRLSDWREHWNDQVDAKWRSCGAQTLQDELGYG